MKVDSPQIYVAGIKNQLFGLPLSILKPMRDEYVKALTQIAVVGQSYSVGERHFTNAEIDQVRQTLMECEAAILFVSGRRATRVGSNFAPRRFWRFGGAGAYGGRF